MTKKNWWSDLNDEWSGEKVVYLSSGDGVKNNSSDYFLGDFVFHRFFGTDDYDAKSVRIVMVEAQKWTQWTEWLEVHRTDKKMLPLYVSPLEQIIMSKKSFRIVRWVDEYRPFDFFPNY